MLRRKISNVGVRTDAGLTCPKCGASQFKAKRSGFGKTLVAPLFIIPIVGAVAGAALPKTRVQCVACGKVFTRG
jgi:ssDNA-binding Zn-finger/Zn-ribbon topoisomerase 1